MCKISHKNGRVQLTLTAHALGENYMAIFTGGRPHAGAASLAIPDTVIGLLSAPGHKDGEIAARAAAILADKLGTTVVCVCGIHYDNITQEEIALIREMAHIMAMEMAELLMESPDD